MSLSISHSDLEDPAVFNLSGLTAPPGVIPDFAHPRNREPVFIIVNGILLALMMIFIAIRFYTKLAIIRKVSWDDLTASLSALGAITLYVLFFWRKSFSYQVIECTLTHRPSQRSKGCPWEYTNGTHTQATSSEMILVLFVLRDSYDNHVLSLYTDLLPYPSDRHINSLAC